MTPEQFAKQVKENVGIKDDAEKTQLELLSPVWLFGVGKVLTFGARKYAAHNWRKGIHLSRLLGACLRHVLAFLGGQNNDPETGISHLYHASCCLMFAAELHQTREDLDDRYTVEKDVALAPAENEIRHARETLQEIGITDSSMMNEVEGEWIVVNMDGKDVTAFVPTLISSDELPKQIFLKGKSS